MNWFSIILTTVVGIVCIILGIVNMNGNISTLHSYHISRVSPEDIPSFGKLVGLGTIITGCSVIVFGVFNFISEILKNNTFVIFGIVAMAVGMIIGLVITLYAMVKYNKGIF